jgi:diguanylate cyclase (GGDEF)-like protein/PAS domain S-box-containing protein
MWTQAMVIDQTLRYQLEGIRWALESLRGALAPDSNCSQACRTTLLRSLKRAMPGVRALLAIGPDGRIALSDDALGEQRLRDRHYLDRLARVCNGSTLFISHAYDVQRKQANIDISMSLAPGDGCGRGAVSAILNPDYFSAVMRSALYAPDMVIALSDLSGRRLLFVPPEAASSHPPAPVTTLAFAPTFGDQRPTGAGATTQRVLATDGTRRLAVQRSMKLGDLGMERVLVISLERDIASIDAGWQRLALFSLLGWLLFWSACAIAVLLSHRRRTVAEALAGAAERERADAAERVELALAGANMGLWDWDIPSGHRSVDARACAILGYTPDELVARGGDGNPIVLVHDDDRDALQAALDDHVRGDTPAFEAEFRMRHRNGHWIWVQSRGQVVARAADGSAVRMVGTRSDISARKQAEADIAQLAFYDGLTGLPNRRLLMDRLHHALAKTSRNADHGAVLFLDLDNFKMLNDTRGHDVGDRLLEMVAFRLQQVTRDVDTVARLGGDEFVVVLEHLGADAAATTAHAELVAGKILQTLSHAYTLDGLEARSTPSIGVALFGSGTQAAHDVLRQADMAMYEAKSAGGAVFRFFDPRMQAAVDATTNLETDLRFAIGRREFELYYQPVVDQQGTMTGAEALIRWHHPRTGIMAPGGFIAQAEKSGLIVDIGTWVLREACLQLASWAREEATRTLTLAVNVSARQFRQDDFVADLLELVAQTGVNPGRLKLELTESVLLTDVEDTIARMQALKIHGIGFSLDDFGTGYSSLSYLQRLPLDQLKIDQSFVRDMLQTRHAASIVQAIVQLATNLGLNVVAEGVETQDQWHRLRDIGCAAFQGYLFARPMPLSALTGLQTGAACAGPVAARFAPVFS